MVIDPLGQGERLMYYSDNTGESLAGGPTAEHTTAGLQCLILGDNVARYRVWDGMRAVDYLQSRRDVIPDKIGVTGCSGGGTASSYLAALDNRVLVGAPSCYLTTYEELWKTQGPQDAEQALVNSVRDGFDLPDLVHMHAPRPYIMLFATGDFFPIAGARNNFNESRRLFGLLGAADMVTKVEIDAGHGFPREHREPMATWMNKHLKGIDKKAVEPDMPRELARDLWVTENGQVMASLGGRTVFSINREKAVSIIESRQNRRNNYSGKQREQLIESVKKQMAYQPCSENLNVREVGSIKRSGYEILRLAFTSEPGIYLPGLLFLPDVRDGKIPAVLFLPAGNKDRAAAIGGDAESLCLTGKAVLVVETRGSGETIPESGNRGVGSFIGPDYNTAYRTLWVGKTMVGMRVLDVIRAVDLLAERREIDPKSISGLARGRLGLVLLHAAAIDPRIRRVAVEGTLASWDDFVLNKYYRINLGDIVPGSLPIYDLVDLAGLIAPRTVWLVNPADQLGKAKDPTLVLEQYQTAQKAFTASRNKSGLNIKESPGRTRLAETYANWLK
jgi:cephalosporin-C deacetylase-like acetyl esterase